MNFIRKIIACLLLSGMVFGITGCTKTSKSTTSSSAASSAAASQTASSSETAADTTGVFTLPYTSVTNFNPLLPASEFNQALWPLIYDCVSEPNTNYSPVMQLAASVTSTGNTATITLRSGVNFSDGKSLSGTDVEYTYRYVKSNPQSPYYSNLSNVSSISADGLTVTLTLKTPDPLIANLLDIPIIESGTEAGDAVGSGKYVYAKNGVNAMLTKNKSWFKGGSLSYSTIPLENIPDKTTVMSCLSIGDINYVYSDNGSGPAPTYVNTKTASVNLNRLVFIGINTSKQRLNNAHFRRALSLSIDRKLLTSQTFSNKAVPSVLPFNPSLSLLAKQSEKDITANYNAASAEMTQAGGTGGTGAPTLTLLVNSENAVRVAAAKYAASCFSKAGVNVTVKSVPFTQYQNLLSQKNFDLYIGEIQMSDNMDISPLLTAGGTSAFGVPANSSTYTAFKKWQAGSANMHEVTAAFNSETPILPLCYRLGTTSYTRGIKGVTATDGDIFFNFEDWHSK